MGIYSPTTVFSSIDKYGRYAFGNQPAIVQWNMARFAETLLPLIHKDKKKAIDITGSLITEFSERFKQRYHYMMATKLGLFQSNSTDHKLIFGLLDRLEQKRLDYTSSFDLLTQSFSSSTARDQIGNDLGDWFSKWRQRLDNQQQSNELAQARMRQANPLVVPKNYHMEKVIEDCVEYQDAHTAEAFLEVLLSPYTMTSNMALYQKVPDDADVDYQTFCGT
jgi:uncharacterized protein YdiU (UPF0061 family)